MHHACNIYIYIYIYIFTLLHTDTQEFAKKTGMPEEMVNNWFINARKRSRDPRDKPAYGGKKQKSWQINHAESVANMAAHMAALPGNEVIVTASLAPPPPADMHQLHMAHLSHGMPFSLSASPMPMSATPMIMTTNPLPILASSAPIPSSSVTMPPPPASDHQIPANSDPIPATSVPEEAYQAAPAADR
jgi:hypothetical protein